MPTRGATEEEIRSWVVLAARAAASKQAHDVVVLRVGEILGITEWFVICDASNPRQVKTVTEEVEKQLVDAGGPSPRAVEGLQGRHWVLIDYGDFVVHVFLDEARTYYDLERLWSDVGGLDWESGDEVGSGVTHRSVALPADGVEWLADAAD